MRICELYKSKQGEGLLTGTESVFIRTSGCNLRCHFCDTPFASWDPEGDEISVASIVQQCRDLAATHVVITGGEPMLPMTIVALTEALHDVAIHITIETAGTIDRPVVCDLMSISPKLSNSTPDAERHAQWATRHEARRHRPDVIRRLTEDYDYQIKFVVDHPDDLREIESWLDAFPQIRTDRVLLMPQGTTTEVLEQRDPWIRDYCASRGFRFCPRMHIVWYGNRRGT